MLYCSKHFLYVDFYCVGNITSLGKPLSLGGVEDESIFKYVLIVFFVILFACFIIIKNKAHKANAIELNKEPTFINTSINDELLVIVDGELVKYDSQLNTINVELDLIITKAYGCDDDLWVIDDKANLYNLYIGENNTYELSDVILENVEYVTGDTSGAIAITTEGDVYVWGRGDE